MPPRPPSRIHRAPSFRRPVASDLKKWTSAGTSPPADRCRRSSSWSQPQPPSESALSSTGPSVRDGPRRAPDPRRASPIGRWPTYASSCGGGSSRLVRRCGSPPTRRPTSSRPTSPALTCSCVPTSSAWYRQGRRCCSRSEEHTSELQSPCNLVCRLLLEKKKKKIFSLLVLKKKKKKNKYKK